MPLPHFLMLILAVVMAAALTLLASFAAGVPEVVLALIVLGAAAWMHLRHRRVHDHEG
ncbi:hypothetical protein [Paracoccus salsus]|uniref:hypothetical protein n=1 Tax=Paracoccus salsus TaxID=2911061 RepID=UPI001F393C04|nr:hypothetical protein [Paracoccus salsus]MCF3973165.1 hypothetical protein [Paracoccus salsus]